MRLEPTGLIQAVFNPLTHCYETPDGTAVAAELCENVESAGDAFRIASIREAQRAAIAQAKGGAA